VSDRPKRRSRSRRTVRVVRARLDYELAGDCTLIFNIFPTRQGPQRLLDETLRIVPERPVDWYTREETGARYARLTAPRGPLTVDYRGSVSCPPAPALERERLTAALPSELPMSVLHYVYPSRFCESDQMVRLAFNEFGHHTPGIHQVEAITGWLNRNIQYLYGTTGPITSALHTATHRVGVCRDFAHLGIALCRALNLPARYVCGFAEGIQPPDFHAMMEVWLGGRWVMFDPTGQAVPSKMVRIATGRDASDASFAFLFGPAALTDMMVDCQTLPKPGEQVPGRGAP